MKEEVKVSIIVPVYNAEKYIERCIKSLIGQTYKNIEIILINDGSEDKSLNILRNFENRDKRITLINQENSGPSKARNLGINKSTGNYIAFIDADDYVELNYIEKMIKQSNCFKSDMIVCNYKEVRKEGEIPSNIFTFINNGEAYDCDTNCIGEVLCGRGGLVWGKLLKSSIIKENKIRFDENISMCEDLLFTLEFIKNTKVVSKIDDYLYIHNKYNDESITAKYNKELFNEQVKVQRKLEQFVYSNNFNNSYIENLLYERLKGIMWFSIYKEIINEDQLRFKLSNINKIIRNEMVVESIYKFSRNGCIDKAIMKSIEMKNSRLVYILSLLRIGVSDLRVKIKNQFK